MPDSLTDPFAQELARLVPMRTSVTPAAVLFAAGEQSAEIKAKRWRNATAVMAMLFVSSWVGMAMRPFDPNQRQSVNSGPDYASTPPAPSPDLKIPQSSKFEELATPYKPVPQILANNRPDEETQELRAKGIRLKHDILAGGLGMLPDEPKSEQPRIPNTSSMELNPTVYGLGGHYTPKNPE